NKDESNPKTKKQQKAAGFLQRYEEAAQIARALKEPITINTIARNIKPKSISAPAISHSISKYKSEIIGLLNSSDTNWMLIRTYFTPIKNLAEKFTN
ncbi:MAG: hypothetical protein HQ541_01010, partial [Mariniphaga sp.]|nr:hypothetical protein [Mariniphaga sp.]